MSKLKASISIFVAAVCMSVFAANLSAQPLSNEGNGTDSAQTILQRYADAWRGTDEMEVPEGLDLAFSVQGTSGGEYSLALSGAPGGTVREGTAAQYDIRFELDIELLRRIDRGEMNALTAMGQAKSSDPIPLNPEFGPEFRNRSDASILFRRLSLHFWNRAWPEVYPFGESAAREVHGANAAVFVYDREFRSAWYQIKPGMHVNEDPSDQINDFPQLVVVTRGRFNARFDGRVQVLSEGQSILIPPGMRHEFWAEDGQYGEIVWTAFGDGA